MKIYYREGYKYQICETYLCKIEIVGFNVKSEYINLSPEGLLMISKGYAWDGPSGLTIDTKNSMRGSLVHDALYQLIREKKLPKEVRPLADEELKRICREDGMSKARSWVWFKAVRDFASFAANPKNDKPILIAP